MLEQSITAFKKAIALKPDYADAYSNMSATYRDPGKLDDAINACKKAITFKPNNPLAYNMGSILRIKLS